MEAKRNFSRDVYHQSQAAAQDLKSQLPKETVGGIVEEILGRVKSRRKLYTYSINTPARDQVERLAYALIGDDASESLTLVQDIQEDGARLDAIYLNYLAEAAVILGDWWDNDDVSFAEVAVGSSRIYAIMRTLSHLFIPEGPVEVKSAVFATVPGETHLLGVRMAADLLGKEGWDIDLKVSRSHDELVDEIAASNCLLIGLSAAGRHSAPALAKLVMALRVSNPATRIFLSGQIVNEAADLIALMGLDDVAHDLTEGRKIMETTWNTLQRAAE